MCFDYILFLFILFMFYWINSLKFVVLLMFVKNCFYMLQTGLCHKEFHCDSVTMTSKKSKSILFQNIKNIRPISPESYRNKQI